MQLLLIAATLQLAPVQAPRDLPLAGIQRARAFDVDSKGEHLAVGYQDGRVLLVTASDGATVRELAPAGPEVPWALRFSPDGERLAYVDHGGGLRIVELAGTALVVTHRALPDDERPEDDDFGALVSWSPTGAHLLVSDMFGNSCLWTSGGKSVRQWKVSGPYRTPQVAWLADGGTLFVADGSRVRALRANDGEERSAESWPGSIECGEAVVAFAFHPGGEQVVSGHDNRLLFTWTVSSGSSVEGKRFVEDVGSEMKDEIADLAYSPAGDRLAYSTREVAYVIVQDVASGDRIWTSDFLGAHFGEALTIAWDPRGESLWFAFECGDGMLFRRAPDGTLARLGEAFVPRFGGDVAVTIANGDLIAFDLDGQRRWRRVERRNGERTSFEILDRRSE